MIPSKDARTRAADKDAIADVLLTMVRSLVEELQPKRARRIDVTLDSTLDRDLGLDSLARTELIARLEQQFGVALSDTVYASAETPRDLLTAVYSARRPRTVVAATVPISLVVGHATPAPYSAQTLVEALEWHVQQHPERSHVRLYAEDGGATETLSYRDLHTGAMHVAAGLHALGIQPGQRVALMLPTGRDYFLAFYGAVLAAAVPVPLYPPARPSQLEDHLRRQRGILDNSGAAVLVTSPEVKPLARLLKTLTSGLRDLVTVADLTAVRGVPPRPARSGDDLALLQYTSGSTGNPKGVMLTHANLLANIRAMGEAVAAGPEDVFVSWLPLYHDMGLIGAWLGSLYYAIPLVIMSPLAFIARPLRWLRAIHEHRGTLSAAPNFAYELCLKRLDEPGLAGLNLSSWRLVFNGAEPVSATTVERFSARFARYGFRREAMMPVYGLAECSVGLAFPPPNRGPLIDSVERQAVLRDGIALPATPPTPEPPLRYVSCGSPLPGHDIRIVDAAGRELPERHVGRLQFRGPSATAGYFHNPDETRRLFQGEWLESGDLGYAAAGEIYVTGRTKDLIIRGGRNLAPYELEEAVGNLPGVRKGCVAVFGSPDPDSGTERLVVMAETRAQDAAERDALRNRINAVATELYGEPPDDIALVPPHAVLKTSSGKIRRSANRERYERGRTEPRGVRLQIARLGLAALLPQGRRMARRAGNYAYAGYAWTLLGIAAITAAGVVMLAPTTSLRWRGLHGLARALARAVRVTITVYGEDGLPPPGLPCVVVANHSSYIDALVLTAALPRSLRFVAKAELAQRPLLAPLLRRLDTQIVDRYDRIRSAVDAERLAQTAEHGPPLLFFPEGTFTRTPGLQPFYLGAFVAAAASNLPIVPVTLRGTRNILRSGSWFPRRGTVVVTIGRPIYPHETVPPATDAWTTALQLHAAARTEMLRHCGEPDLGGER